jgi:hypothetical protein
VGEQLCRGIRYLDLRITGTSTGGGRRGGVTIVHGCVRGTPLSGVLQQIADFLYQHPRGSHSL